MQLKGDMDSQLASLYEERERLRTTIGYLASDDGGRTWVRPDGETVELPANSATVSVLATAKVPGVDVLRGGPLGLNADGRPHILYRSLSDWPSQVLLGTLQDDGTWLASPLRVSDSDVPSNSITHSGTIAFTSASVSARE